jgi:glycosyltransferase involved in cell wall biosynthesis
MHLLVVAVSFPSPERPYRTPFLGEQVRLLCKQAEVERVTVVSPTTFVPAFMRRVRRVSAQATLPDRYQLVEGRCEVRFPRYFKAPGSLFPSWTRAQWRHIIDQTVAEFAKTCPVSLIHANSGAVSAWAALYVAKRYNIPCVVTYQGSEVHVGLARHRKGWQLCRDSFRLADLNLPVSRQLEAILKRHAEPTGRCEILLRGVDQTRFFPAPELTTYPRVLFVGHILEAKGVFDLLSAWTKVRLSCPKAVLTMVGQDYTKGRFTREARALGVDSSIVLSGPLPLPRVANLMRQSRLLCLPSHGEGTPNCIMEALSCGLPVVATRVGGIPDIVEHEKTGLLVNTGDVDGLAAALVCVLRDLDLSVRMGQAAQDFAREHLDARKTVSRLVKLYGELIAARSANISGRDGGISKGE